MKKILAIAALVLAAGILAAAPPEDVTQALVKLENDWARAALARDVAALEKILAPDYVFTSADAQVVSRAEWMAGLKSGSSKYETFTVEDMKVYVHGEAAVVIGKGSIKGTENGKAVDEHDRFTDTWVKHDGHWVAVATQSTRIPKK